MRGILRENGLTLVVLALFLVFMLAQTLAGAAQLNEERRSHGEPPLALSAYLASGHFLEATAENWESEFLQMAAYVLLTVGLSGCRPRPGLPDRFVAPARTSGSAARAHRRRTLADFLRRGPL